MKNLKITGLICGGILSLSGSALWAQQPSTSTGPSSSSSSSQSTLSSSGTLGASSSTHGSSSSMSGNSVRLSQIMNGSVQSHEGKTLGQIRDVMVDPHSGRIEFAILSLSSAGGASDTSTSGRETVPSSRSSVAGTPSSSSGYTTMGKLIPVPWQLLSQGLSSGRSSSTTSSSTLGSSSSMGSPNLVLNIDESKLRSAPSFDASNWNELQSGTFDQRVYSYFGVDRSSGFGTSGSIISGQGGSSTGSRGTSGSQGTSSGSDSRSSSSPHSSSSSSTPPQSSSSSSADK